MDFKLEVVVIPVSDVERSKRFYADQLGFHVDVDVQPSPQMRVVQLTPPGSSCSVTIGPMVMESPPRAVQLQLVVEDIEAAHAEFEGREVDVTPVRHFEGSQLVDGNGGPLNTFFFFQDPDGNGWAVQLGRGDAS
jgi:catechol 2,3-dioxygenase-like lactoylglutathione lyase family enzyme